MREDRTYGSAWLSERALEVVRDKAALAVEGRRDDRLARAADGDDWVGMASLAERLLAARPSMAVVTNRVNRAMSEASETGTPAAVENAAHEGIERALDADADAATVAAERLPARVATLSRSRTVLSALREREPEAVLVAESRPGREGVGVAERLADALGDETTVTLTSDAAFPAALTDWDAQALVVGADRILPDGRVVNKVGTHGGAVAATAADVPCYVVAASDKIAVDHAVELEPHDADELYDGDAPLAVYNPTFDVTPASAVDAILTERGAVTGAALDDRVAAHRRLAAWNE